MKLEAGVTAAKDSVEGHVWNVVGHIYTPKLLSANAFIWHAVVPDGTFVPPHVHPTQDEWIEILDGHLEFEFGADVHTAGPGDIVRMPMGKPHAFYNRSGTAATCVAGVAPARRLFDLFIALNGVSDPEELVRLSALHEVNFLPPPA